MAFGLYIHVPFCSEICHYCDFAKTALFTERLIQDYLEALKRQTEAWLKIAERAKLLPLTSVFFGGGTPGLLSSEYHDLMAVIRPHLAVGAEVSLEANPDNITAETLATWRSLGFNRLSIGIQTFDPNGLKFLTRGHSSATCRAALALAGQYFDNVNADLIYGWIGQDIQSWRHDLDQCRDLGIPHLSLYNLTYEPRTTIGRRQARGRLKAMAEDAQHALYEEALLRLDAYGYIQDEVSNWTRPGFSCQHNWLYWRCDSYLAVGAGAAGFVPSKQPWGLRYRYPNEAHAFAKLPTPEGDDFESLAKHSGALVDTRNTDDWLLEYIGCGLRTSEGIRIDAAEGMSGLNFQPRPVVKMGLDQGLLQLNDLRYLSLSPREWFRENAWATEVAMSFTH